MEAMTPPSRLMSTERTAPADGGVSAIDDRWVRVFLELAEGRLSALDDLYDLAATDVYRLALWRTGSREDAEDVVQDVFVKVAEQGPRLAAVRQPKRWLLTVAHRMAVDLCRGRTRRATESVDEIPFLEAPGSDPDREVEARSLSRFIARLPEKQREVLLLRHFADCTFREIGGITGVPTFTAASRYRLAMIKLRRELEIDDE